MAVRFVHVATFDDPAEAEAVRRSLLSDGIIASVVPVIDTGKARLEVQEEFAADVDELLEGCAGVVRVSDEKDTELSPLASLEAGPRWTCPRCNVAVEDQRFTCPECGCLRPSRSEAPLAPWRSTALAADQAQTKPADTPAQDSAASGDAEFRIPVVGSVERFASPSKDLVFGLLLWCYLFMCIPAFEHRFIRQVYVWFLAGLMGFSVWRIGRALTVNSNIPRRQVPLALVTLAVHVLFLMFGCVGLMAASSIP
jgi:hypothetical protein